MKKTVSFLLFLLFPAVCFAGSANLDYTYSTELTDASPTVNRVVDCKRFTDVVAFVTTDKGSDITITPIVTDDESVVGPVSDTLTIVPGGGTDAAIYSRIGTPKARVTVTKTEAGTTSGFTLNIRGVE